MVSSSSKILLLTSAATTAGIIAIDGVIVGSSSSSSSAFVEALAPVQMLRLRHKTTIDSPPLPFSGKGGRPRNHAQRSSLTLDYMNTPEGRAATSQPPPPQLQDLPDIPPPPSSTTSSSAVPTLPDNLTTLNSSTDILLDPITEHIEEIMDEIGIVDDVFKSSSLSISAPIVLDQESVPTIHMAENQSVETSSLTADESVATSKSKSKSETRKMISEVSAIALPSLGGMLLDPIMSLVDTACVGQVSTTALAAMAPCTSIFQFAFFAFFFLSAATTNLVAGNPPEAAMKVNNYDEAKRRVELNERVVSNASVLALILGSLVTMSLVKFADPLLQLAGIPASNVALLNAARPYLLIRAMGIPFVFLATVLQGSSLGRGDAWRPLKIFGAAGVINLVGDVWLTLFKGWGATGAATATVAAQVGAAIYYVITSSRLDKSVEASSKPLRDVALNWRGLPSKKIIKTFMEVAVALFSRSIGLMLAYSMLTRTAALSGTTALAAHQVTLQVWWLLSFLPEPMSVAAQTLITRDMKDRQHRVPKLIKTLFGMSGVLGLAAAGATAAVLRAPAIASTLVADVTVQKLMASLVPFAVLSQSYCPIATLSDGVCIGLGSFGHLPVIMVASFLATVAGLGMVASNNLGVVGVWGCMNVFLASRILGHLIMSTKLRKYLKKAFSGGDRSSNQGKDLQAVPVGVSL